MKKSVVFILIIFISFTFFLFKAEAASPSEKFIDDLSLDFISGDNDYSALATIHLNYAAINENTDVQNEEELLEVRQENKEYHSFLNERIIQNFPKLLQEITISNYSPFLFIEYKTYEEYDQDKMNLRKISQLDIVKYVHIENHKNENIEDSTTNTKLERGMSYSDLKDMINVGTTDYTGKGIKVGVIAKASPIFRDGKAIDNIKKDFCIENEEPSTLYEKRYHTSKVLSLLAGEAGLATDVEIYIYPAGERSKFYTMKETPYEMLLDCGVNIINYSGCFDQDDGNYLEWSAYIDYLVAHNNVVIVNAVGNESKTKLIRYTATPANVIAVGSVNYDRTVADYSSYKVLSPDRRQNIVKLVAPGNVNFSIGTFKESHAGTSYSAPLVSAVVAMLMEEFPSCKYMPELIMNALMHSATKLPNQILEIDPAAGAGILNYQEARKILRVYQEKIDNTHKNQEDNSFQFVENTTVSERDCIVNIFENSTFYDDTEVVNFDFYNMVDAVTLTFTSMSEYYKNWENVTMENKTTLHFARYRLCVVSNDEILYTLSSFSNFFKAKMILEPERWYTINVYMITQLPSFVPDRLSIILTK